MTTPPPLLASQEQLLVWANEWEAAGASTVCAQLRQAATALEALAAENGALEAALSASVGHMLNAMIGLDAGGTKAAAIKTLESGITLARATLNGAPQP